MRSLPTTGSHSKNGSGGEHVRQDLLDRLKSVQADAMTAGLTPDDLLGLADRVGATGKPNPPAAKGEPARKPLDPGITLDALMAADLPEPECLVAGLLPVGLSLLAARPKAGKSWLALQVAIAVAAGRPCLGDLATRRAPVLYLALEDTRRRLKKRAGLLLRGLGLEDAPPAGLDLRVAWRRAGAGGLCDIAEWFAGHKGGLAIVDTLARYRDPVRGRGNSYQEDYDAVAGLKEAADAHGGAVLGIHHTRKGVADDPFDEVSGTLGVNGAADSLMVLDRIRGQAAGTLYLTGRDLADETLTLAWSADAGLWTLGGRAEGVARLERPAEPDRAERCAEWLAAHLAGYAWPDQEVEAAAAGSGYTASTFRRAKALLRRAEPPLASRKRGFAGEWWVWLGGDQAPADRPTPGQRTSAVENGENGENGVFSGKTGGRPAILDTTENGGNGAPPSKNPEKTPFSPFSPFSTPNDTAAGDVEVFSE